VVHGTYVPMTADDPVRVDWSSKDGGETWTFTPLQSGSDSPGS